MPLEAQRLGLEAYASDLNPVAVPINKAMIANVHREERTGLVGERISSKLSKTGSISADQLHPSKLAISPGTLLLMP